MLLKASKTTDTCMSIWGFMFEEWHEESCQVKVLAKVFGGSFDISSTSVMGMVAGGKG